MVIRGNATGEVKPARPVCPDADSMRRGKMPLPTGPSPMEALVDRWGGKS